MGACVCMHVACSHHTTHLANEHGEHALHVYLPFLFALFLFSPLFFSLYSLFVASSSNVSKTSDVSVLLRFLS